MADSLALRSRFRAFEREHPGIHKVPARTWDEVCEERAVEIYGAAVGRAGGVRAVARRSECDPKTIRDRRDGARGIEFKEVLKLGRAGLYELAERLTDFADEQPDDVPDSRSGTDG